MGLAGIMTEITTKEIAAEFGVTSARVRAIAANRGLTDRLSRKVGPIRLWKRSAIEALRPRPTGRPRVARK